MKLISHIITAFVGAGIGFVVSNYIIRKKLEAKLEEKYEQIYKEEIDKAKAELGKVSNGSESTDYHKEKTEEQSDHKIKNSSSLDGWVPKKPVVTYVDKEKARDIAEESEYLFEEREHYEPGEVIQLDTDDPYGDDSEEESDYSREYMEYNPDGDEWYMNGEIINNPFAYLSDRGVDIVREELSAPDAQELCYIRNKKQRTDYEIQRIDPRG